MYTDLGYLLYMQIWRGEKPTSDTRMEAAIKNDAKLVITYYLYLVGGRQEKAIDELINSRPVRQSSGVDEVLTPGTVGSVEDDG